ncbi:MAG: hypothetical protein V3V10_07205 [Planctomycetota bacterium]
MKGFDEFMLQLQGEADQNPLNVESLLLHLRDNPSRWAVTETPTAVLVAGTDSDSAEHDMIGAVDTLTFPARVNKRKGFVTVIEEVDIRPSDGAGGDYAAVDLKFYLKQGTSKQNPSNDLLPFDADAFKCATFGPIKRQIIVPEDTDFRLYYKGAAGGTNIGFEISMVLRREPVDLARMIWPHLMRGR